MTDTVAASVRYSLYKGALGTALLWADLEQPADACIPMFESEGWALPTHGSALYRDTEVVEVDQ
jgi:hypothetical protein